MFAISILNRKIANAEFRLVPGLIQAPSKTVGVSDYLISYVDGDRATKINFCILLTVFNAQTYGMF